LPRELPEPSNPNRAFIFGAPSEILAVFFAGAVWHHLHERWPAVLLDWPAEDRVGRATGVTSVARKSVVAAGALVGAIGISTHAMAFGHGAWGGGGAHFAREGFAGHRIAISRGGFAHPFAFRKAFATGGLWSYYDYGYVPTDSCELASGAGLAQAVIAPLICGGQIPENAD